MSRKSDNAFPLDRYLTKMSGRVDAALDRWLPAESVAPPTIHRAMRYSLFAGGKRLRPVLCLAACEAVGGRVADAMPLACALECIHTYSLIHDDLPCMDDDDLRRGKPTSHKVFGEGIAVLAGDALLTEAFALAARAECAQPYPVRRMIKELALAAGSQRLIAGQVQDLESENKQVTLEWVKQIHLNKTAALIAASIRLGAMAGKATAVQFRRLSRYGQDLGLAFQIIDDILDATSTREAMGKSVRADQKNLKATYPAVAGLEKSRRIAAELIADAQNQIKPFGNAAAPLRAIADYFLTRQH